MSENLKVKGNRPASKGQLPNVKEQINKVEGQRSNVPTSDAPNKDQL